MAEKRHSRGTCIVCDLNRLDEEKPAAPLGNDGSEDGR